MKNPKQTIKDAAFLKFLQDLGADEETILGMKLAAAAKEKPAVFGEPPAPAHLIELRDEDDEGESHVYIGLEDHTARVEWWNTIALHSAFAAIRWKRMTITCGVVAALLALCEFVTLLLLGGPRCS